MIGSLEILERVGIKQLKAGVDNWNSMIGTFQTDSRADARKLSAALYIFNVEYGSLDV